MISITFYLGIFSVIFSLAQLGVFFWDKSYYFQVFGNLDVDLDYVELSSNGSMVMLVASGTAVVIEE